MYTYLTLVESILVASLVGFSTIAVVFYWIHARSGYPLEEVGKVMARSIYKMIRWAHGFLFITANISMLLGFLDGKQDFVEVYRVILILLVVNFLLPLCMTKKLLSTHLVAPIVAAIWNVLGVHYFYWIIVGSPIALPVLGGVFVAYTTLFYIIFWIARNK